MTEIMVPPPGNFNRYYVSIRKVWDKPMVRRFSEATATLFLIAFFLLVALKPTIETIFTLNKKISDARETESAMTKKIADINTAMALFQSVEADLARLDESIPSEAKANVIINIINQNINKTHMDSASYTLGSYSLGKDPVKSIGPSKYSVNITTNGNYPNLVSFLQNFAAAKRIITPENIAISKSKDEKILNIVINSNTYYEKK